MRVLSSMDNLRRTIVTAGIGALLLRLAGRPAEASETRYRTLLVVGQSLALPWSKSAVRREFERTRAARGDDAVWRYVVAASGGSSALREFCGSIDGNWWYDVDEKRPGPVLERALDAIRRSPRPPTEVLWVQGQQEGWMYRRGKRFTLPRSVFKRRYKDAVLRISLELRREIAGTNWRSVPFYIQTLGTRATGDAVGDRLVREAQLEIIAERGARWNIRLGGIQPFDLPLRDHVHPNPVGEVVMGRINARAIDL